MNTTIPKGIKGITSPKAKVGYYIAELSSTIVDIERVGHTYTFTLDNGRKVVSSKSKMWCVYVGKSTVEVC